MNEKEMNNGSVLIIKRPLDVWIVFPPEKRLCKNEQLGDSSIEDTH